MPTTADDLEARRRRAQWRAAHRGTRELDMLIGGYAAAVLPDMSEAELLRFEEFLNLADPELQAWLLAADLVPGLEHAATVAAIRRFHGLDEPAKAP